MPPPRCHCHWRSSRSRSQDGSSWWRRPCWGLTRQEGPVGTKVDQGGSRRTRVDQPSFSLPETSSRPLTQPSRQACSSQVLVMLVQILRWQCCLQPSSLLVKTTRRETIREYQQLAAAPRSQLDNWQWSTDSNTILANCKLSLSCQSCEMSFVFHGANSETSLFPPF